MTDRLDGRTLIVTGASRGIGAAVSQCLLEKGATVIGIARDFQHSTIDDARFRPVPLDLAQVSALPDVLSRLAKTHTEITGLVCCAGRGRFGSLEEFAYKDIRELVDLNLTSQMYVVRAFMPIIKTNGGGDVVLMGSEAALSGGRYGAVYSATKFAVRGFAQALRHECAAANVRITIVNPGMVRTKFFDSLKFEPGADPDNYIEPEDVASAVCGALSVRRGTVMDEINLSPLKRVVRRKIDDADNQR
ncbi:MAG: SDR family oxidoreductase [Pseudomonadota bacterium]|nr:SDR family oxidoreductase [Pseudomonadota bacterium]